MSSNAYSERVAWNLQTVAISPPPRKGGCMAYDTLRGVTVLFGGVGVNDTWTWDGTAWVQQQPLVSPSARSSAVMAYDAFAGGLLLFGGIDTNGGLLADTWFWDGQNWVQRQTANAPLARIGASMACDTVSQRIVLFGGMAQGHRIGTLLHDTWLWDGSEWTQLPTTSAPSARQGASCAYDRLRQQVLLFGGTGDGIAYNDTWVWDGTTWSQALPVSSPSPRAWAAMSYHEVIQQVVLVGGGSMDASALSDSWLWDGSAWSQTTTTVPLADSQSMTYDAAHGSLLVYSSSSQSQLLANKQSGGISPHTLLQPTLTGELWTLQL